MSQRVCNLVDNLEAVTLLTLTKSCILAASAHALPPVADHITFPTILGSPHHRRPCYAVGPSAGATPPLVFFRIKRSSYLDR